MFEKIKEFLRSPKTVKELEIFSNSLQKALEKRDRYIKLYLSSIKSLEERVKFLEEINNKNEKLIENLNLQIKLLRRREDCISGALEDIYTNVETVDEREVLIPKRVVEIGSGAVCIYLQMYLDNGLMPRWYTLNSYCEHIGIPIASLSGQLHLMEEAGIVIEGQGVLDKDVINREDIVKIIVPTSVLSSDYKERYKFVKNAVEKSDGCKE